MNKVIKSIKIEQYRKLKNLQIDFDKRINAISGTNGTCKTSLLHLFSNSFQAVTKKCDWVKDDNCLKVLSAVNSITNPKVESLTRGDKQYNDPAHGIKGILFSVDYYNREPLDFRRHNSKIMTRYAVKPKYQLGSGDTLPYCPIVYLGLSRLFPYGEYKDDETIKSINNKLPDIYKTEIARLYKNFTNYTITYGTSQKMGDVKVRTEFSSELEGIDSNTISAGEDNLTIILTALVSLKYYYESIESKNDIESILLIDEVDATLHPAYQIKLLQLFKEYAEQYKIQFVFTTHSMSLIEKMLEYKCNVIYLLDNITNVVIMDDPDIYKIKMHLHSLTDDDIYLDKVIPVFTEDNEARTLLEMIFEYFMELHDEEFRGVQRFFHYVKANIGANVLSSIFSDSKLTRTTMRSVCILDGDQNSDLSNCILTLPGGKCPEQLLLDYAQQLFDNDDSFWTQSVIISKGFGKTYYIENIQNKVKEFNDEVTECRQDEISTKGKKREFNKKLFNDNRTFFEYLFKHWLHDSENQDAIEKFYEDMRKLFKKVSHYHEINSNEWK